MSPNLIVQQERVKSVMSSVSILWRFVRYLPLLSWMLGPVILCLVFASALPQFFLWLIGEYLRCGQESSCQARMPQPFNFEISPSLQILAIIILGICIARIMAWIFFEVSGQWSSQKLHSRMIAGLAGARTTYFDENPSGRLLNRVVGDFEDLRTDGVIRLGDTLNALVEILVIALVVGYANPFAALAIVPALAAFFYIQKQVAPMTQHVGILESVRKGEVLHRETDLIEGGRIFTLYNRARTLNLKLRDSLQRWIEFSLLRAQIESWGRFWLSAVCSVYSFCAIIFLLLALSSGIVTATVAAVVLSALFRLGIAFQWLYWSTGSLNQSAAHARRVFELIDLPHETTEERSQIPSKKLKPAKATLHGDIEFIDFTASYRSDLPAVLHAINLRIPASLHIGLVGRTGSGKSTLVQSLYRMVHVRSGDIRIGGSSIYEFDIEFIRSHFAMVPQDPYLFEGTLRSNLDRYNKLQDHDLHQALLAVELDLDLSFAIKEGGHNLSIGERQLVCLARALLSDAPYIVMDEPTSGIDNVTDAKIQRVLRNVFCGKTVITIAHRIETLQSCDMIVELALGKIISVKRNNH